MVDNIVKGVIVGVLLFVWYFAGTEVPWVSDGANLLQSKNGITYPVPSLGYVIWSYLAFVLARGGKSGGSERFGGIINAAKGYFGGRLIFFIVTAIVMHTLWQVVTIGGFEIMLLVKFVASIIVATLLATLIVGASD